MAVSWAVSFYSFTDTSASLYYAIEMAIFCFMAIIACTVDIRRTILPDTFTLGGIGVALLGAWLNPDRHLTDALWGVVIGGGGLALVSYGYYFLRKTEGMGLGDVKMMGWIGALTGFQSLFYILMMACIFGLFFGIFSFLHRRSLSNFYQSELAFGPYLAFSTYCFVLLSNYGIIG